MRKIWILAALVLPLAACQEPGAQGTDSAGSTAAPAADTSGGATTGAGGGGTGTGTGIPALVNVNLENVLNDLSVRLQVDRANIPVNAQIPIDVAANVCGVSVNVLAVSTGGQASCTAKTATPELAQVVQQQVAAGGSVGGGAQGGSTATTGGSTGTGGGSTSGSTDTSADSTGTTETTTEDPDDPN
jgi:hypothetical protein